MLINEGSSSAKAGALRPAGPPYPLSRDCDRMCLTAPPTSWMLRLCQPVAQKKHAALQILETKQWGRVQEMQVGQAGLQAIGVCGALDRLLDWGCSGRAAAGSFTAAFGISAAPNQRFTSAHGT